MRRREVVAVDAGWLPPAELDGFRVVRQLGRGGMGHVYLGHEDALDRDVALKFLGTADVKPSARERFLVEARAIARLSHPNVVGIYRVGEVQGRPYIAYELVAGKSLDQLPRPILWPGALEIAVGVARGLAAAHRQDVLHRDIKPANVMRADNGQIKIIDFGLAKLASAQATSDRPPGQRQTIPPPVLSTPRPELIPDSPEALAALDATAFAGESAAHSLLGEAALTVTGALIGTPLYMAPELWRGEAATAESDVYALGLLMYELLAGRLPHEGLRASEISQAVQERTAPPLRSVCPAVPQALADVVDRCVRPLRQERFASALEVRDALEAIRSLYRPFAAPLDVPAAVDDGALEITASFGRIAPQAAAFSARMYERLFERHPDIRPLFPADLEPLQRKLFGALQVVVDNLRRPDRLGPLLEDLGRRHSPFGVKPEHFDAVGEALLDAIADHDPLFDERTRRHWAAAYAQIAKAMIRGLLGERPTPHPDYSSTSLEGFEPPRTRYARNGDVTLAYQIIGTGPIDIVMVSGWLTHLEVCWDWPPYVRGLRLLSTLGRVVLFDGRGTGLSDPIAAGQPIYIEDQMADLRAVMDTVGVERAVLFGVATGAAASLLFAATHPERVRALVLYGASAAHPGPEGGAQTLDFERIRTAWGEPLFIEQIAPSYAKDAAFRKWWARMLRSAASPSTAVALLRAGALIDVRAVLPAIRVPCLIAHRKGDRAVPIEQARYLARHLPGARLVELPGDDHLLFDDDDLLQVLALFLSEPAPAADASRVLAAVVSLVPAELDMLEAGPPESRAREDRLRTICEREIARFGGVGIDGIGAGGATAMFDGPARAVRFARAMMGRASALGIGLGAGVAFDECFTDESGVDGAAVHLAPEVAASAAAGEVLVTEAARALLGGSGLKSARRGMAGGARVYALEEPG